MIGSDDYMESDLLNDREKAAVLWAEHVTKNTAKSRDDVYELVRSTFDNTELVELTIICGQFNFRNRFMDSMRIPVEPPKEVDKIKSSVNLDPETVRNYLQLVLDKWPKKFPKVHPDE
ncbi:MAG: carboxymuconolactone decarboxylase family protein [Rhodospirillales bacterium]